VTVDAIDEIGDADEFFDVERAQRLDLSLGRGDHRNFVLGFPFFNNLLFAFIPVHHKRRRAFGMDQIDTLLRQLRDFFFDGVERGAKFIFGAAFEIQINRDDADAFGQQANELFQRSGAVRRFYDTDDAAPTGKNHTLISPIYVQNVPVVPIVQNVPRRRRAPTRAT